MKRSVVLLLAIVSGGLAGYSALRVLRERSNELEYRPTIVELMADSGGVRLALDDGRSFRVDTAGAPINARNLALL